MWQRGLSRVGEAEDLEAEEGEEDAERQQTQEDGEGGVVQEPAGHEGGGEYVCWGRMLVRMGWGGKGEGGPGDLGGQEEVEGEKYARARYAAAPAWRESR